jgi:hypothetical protein
MVIIVKKQRILNKIYKIMVQIFIKIIIIMFYKLVKLQDILICINNRLMVMRKCHNYLKDLKIFIIFINYV